MMGRPKAEINLTPEQAEDLARFGMFDTEIAMLCHVSPQTIGRRFGKNLEKGRGELRKKLKRKQIEVAMKGNVAMLIWVGKQYLGQSDKSESVETVKQTVFTYDGAITSITGRPKGNRRAPSTDESNRDGAAMGQELHGGHNLFSSG